MKTSCVLISTSKCFLLVNQSFSFPPSFFFHSFSINRFQHSSRVNPCGGGRNRRPGEAAVWPVRTRGGFCLQTLHQLHQALDGLCQVVVRCQVAGLQGRAAEAQGLAHKRKQTQQPQLLLSGEGKADLCNHNNNITGHWTATRSASLAPLSPATTWWHTVNS